MRISLFWIIVKTIYLENIHVMFLFMKKIEKVLYKIIKKQNKINFLLSQKFKTPIKSKTKM